MTLKCLTKVFGFGKKNILFTELVAKPKHSRTSLRTRQHEDTN